MAEPQADNAPEGWRVPQRIAFVSAALVPLGLLAIVLLAGWAYDRHLRARHWRPVTTFPAPGVETFIHDGQADPVRPNPKPRLDMAIVAAKRQVAAEGIAGWSDRR